MLNMRDMAAQVKALAPVISDFVKKSLKPFGDRLDEIEKNFDLIPEIDVSVIDKAIERVDLAISGIKNGKDADPDVIKELVLAAVAEIPAPKDGEDGQDGTSVSLDEVKEIVAGVAKQLVNEIPKPKDGESVPIEDVQKMIDEAVEKAVSAIPVPNIEEITSNIEGIAKRLVDEIPRPKDGENVAIEDVEKLVNAAVEKSVEALPKPENGEDGIDALDLEILPEIDTAKSYARGTYAHYEGGLWRSFQKTVGIKGWECIVDGVARVNVEQTDEREFNLTIAKSSGNIQTEKFVMPNMIYRQVFKQGNSYQKGDVVTFNGSLWHCDEPTTDKPETSKSWRLAAKRGRNGTNGINGKDLTKGVSAK